MDIINGPKPWEQRDKEAWEQAAKKLESKGYSRRRDSYWPAVFVKGKREIVLVRDLGMLNWHPRKR